MLRLRLKPRSFEKRRRTFGTNLQRLENFVAMRGGSFKRVKDEKVN
jgi:hypothetical protein